MHPTLVFDISAFGSWKVRSLVRNLTKCDHANVLYLHEALVSDFLGRIPFGASKLCHVITCIWWWGAGGPVTPLLHVRAIFLCPVLMSIDLAHLGLANLCKLFESLLSHQIDVHYWLLQFTVFACICWMFSLKQRNHKKSVHLTFVFFPSHPHTHPLWGGRWTLVFSPIILMASSLGHATIGLRHSMDTGLVGVAGAPSFHCGVCASWMDLGRKIWCRLQGNVRLLQPSLRVWICSSAQLQCMSLPLPSLQVPPAHGYSKKQPRKDLQNMVEHF